jgi:BA14K-like protein
MSLTKKIAAAALSAAVLLTGFASVNQASASGLTREQAAILAGAGGFVLGAMIANSHHRHHSRVIYVEDSWGSHVSRCLDRYATYDPSSDTFVGYDGYEHRCRL